MADNGPPTGGGGGTSTKRRRRKRGGNNKDKDTSAAKDAGNTTTTAAQPSSGGRGNKGKKRGGGGGRGGGGESSSSSRMSKNASSPLQLPHVKVTLRNIGNATKHGTVEGVVGSIRSFLEGTFPSVEDDNGTAAESSAYMMAWQLEKEEFEQNKTIFMEEAASSSSSAEGGSSNTDSSSSIRAFATGVYKEKPSTALLPSNRTTLLPSVEPIVAEINEVVFTSVNSMIDAAMSKMIQECGKQYVQYVGGRVVLDEESAVDCMLAEMIQEERSKVEKNDGEEEEVAAGPKSGEEKPDNDDDDDGTKPSVETVTKGMSRLSTSDSNNISKSNSKNSIHTPAIRVRILSVTPVKKSKRRGEIGAKVQLVLYPPDPCVLFQELCRDAGKLAVEKHSLANGANMVNESTTNMEESQKDEDAMETDKPAEKNDASSEGGKDDNQTSSPSTSKAIPQIPNFPILSSSERSRALARSRILINRTIEAMKLSAKSMNTRGIDNNSPWDIFESPSQKTWKSRQNPMIGSLLAGSSLQDVIAEHDKVKANAAATNKKGRGGFKSREDRYDSTIESSEDYKTFMEHWQNNGSYPTNNPANAVKKEEPVAVDEEGRPLSAIVMDIRKKKDEEAKKKADAKAAAAKAREAARSAQEALKKKEKSKKKKEKERNRRNERKKKAKAAARAPPTLLQKAGAGFGG
eukprot:scaffold4247_cov139-Skeletonema_menzelii.AAC.8